MSIDELLEIKVQIVHALCPICLTSFVVIFARPSTIGSQEIFKARFQQIIGKRGHLTPTVSHIIVNLKIFLMSYLITIF